MQDVIFSYTAHLPTAVPATDPLPTAVPATAPLPTTVPATPPPPSHPKFKCNSDLRDVLENIPERRKLIFLKVFGIREDDC